jgi:glycogen synthase
MTTPAPAPSTRTSAPPERLRVLMTTDAVGGVWTFSLELAAALRVHGIDVVLAVVGPAPSPEQRTAAEAVGLTVEQSPFRLEWMDDPWEDVWSTGHWLAALEQEHGCAVVHLNGFALGCWPFRAPVMVVGHSCVLSWWRAVRGQAAPAALDRYRHAVARGLRAASVVAVPTRWMRGALRDNYGCARDIHVIPNGVSGEHFIPNAPASKEPFVLAAGRVWDEAKNLGALARVAGGLPWPIRIAGPLSLFPGGGDQAAAHGRGDDGTAASLAADLANVERLGVLSSRDMARLYARASVFVSPARYEPFGLSILEAALSGCALLLGDIPSLRELWDGAATFVEPGDDLGLRRALANLIKRPLQRHRGAAQALERARRYRADAMAAAYAAHYLRLLEQQPEHLPPVHRRKEMSCAS